MAIDVKEHWEGRKSTVSDDGVVTYTRVFQAITDDPLIGSLDVREAAGIPAIGDDFEDDYEDDSSSKCISVSPQQDNDDPRKWMVTVEYSTETKTDVPLKISWDVVEQKKALEVDREGAAILNSADDTFDPAPETEEAYLSLTIVKTVRVAAGYHSPKDLAEGFLYKTNINPFYTFIAGQVLLKKFREVQTKIGGDDGREITFEFLIDLGTILDRDEEDVPFSELRCHRLAILDMGMRQRTVNGLDHIQGPSGQLVTKPVLLDHTGFAIVDPTPDKARYMIYDVRGGADFDLLLLT